MKKSVLFTLLALGLTACGNIQPTKSPCFGAGGASASCKFVPLNELHAKGKKA